MAVGFSVGLAYRTFASAFETITKILRGPVASCTSFNRRKQGLEDSPVDEW